MEDFRESAPEQRGPANPNVESIPFEEMKERILKIVNGYNGLVTFLINCIVWRCHHFPFRKGLGFVPVISVSCLGKKSKPVSLPQSKCAIFWLLNITKPATFLVKCIRTEQRRFGANSLRLVVEQLIQILFKYFLCLGSLLLSSAYVSCSLNLRGTTQERRSFSEGQRRSVCDELFSFKNANKWMLFRCMQWCTCYKIF